MRRQPDQVIRSIYAMRKLNAGKTAKFPEQFRTRLAQKAFVYPRSTSGGVYIYKGYPLIRAKGLVGIPDPFTRTHHFDVSFFLCTYSECTLRLHCVCVPNKCTNINQFLTNKKTKPILTNFLTNKNQTNMNEKILEQLTKIVENTMIAFKSDFYQCDKIYIEHATDDKFPMVWSVGTKHTCLSKLGEFEDILNRHEPTEYMIRRGENPFEADWCSGLHRNNKFFLLQADGSVTQITKEQFKEVVRDVITPAIVRFEEKNGKLTPPKRVEFKLHNITLSRLKELIREGREHNDDSLLNCLKRLRNIPRYYDEHRVDVRFYEDYLEFRFTETCGIVTNMIGGIVFHGWKETGYQQNYSVQLTPTYGWQIHT